jgi:DNA polymerase-3 subunit beta
MNKGSISIASKDFHHAVAIASLAVERRNTIPILGQLRCRANGSFEVAGTDLDVLVTAKIDHGGGPSAEFMLPDARSLSASIKASGADDVALSTDAGKIRLDAGALGLTINRPLPADDFPADAGMEAEVFSASLSMEQIRSLSRVASAVSTEETRYYLNGVYIHHVGDQTYRAAATDGHRLCFVDLILPDAAGALPGVIMPRKAIRMMLHLAGKPSSHDEGVRFAVGNRNAPNRETSTAPEKIGSPTRAALSFKVGNASVGVSTKLIDGTFPDYSRVVPHATEATKTFVFQASELRRAVEALRHCATGNVRAVKMVFDDDAALISAHYAESSIDSAMRISCQHHHAGFEVGFNGGYLLSMIEAAAGGELVMSIVDQSAPALIKNPADTAWTGVLMPMRV